MLLGPVRDDEAILLAGDLSSMTDPADTMERRLVRIAAHYRQRALMAEDALDSMVTALDPPGDHCEIVDAAEFARRVLALVPKT